MSEVKKNEVELSQSSLVDWVKNHGWPEIGWPVASMLLFLRPLHHFVTGKIAKIEQGQKVLEVGSGIQLYKMYADKVGHSGLFVAVDINKKVQERSRKIGCWLDDIRKLPSESRKVSHMVADIAINHDDEIALPYADSSFDLVIGSNTPGDYETIAEIFRIIKPGGKMLYAWNESLLDQLPGRHTVTERRSEICKKVGFGGIKIRIGAPGSIPLMLPKSPIPIFPAWNWYVEASKPITDNSKNS